MNQGVKKQEHIKTGQNCSKERRAALGGTSGKKASTWLPTLRNRTEFRGFESHIGQLFSLKKVLPYVVDMHMPVFYTAMNTVPTCARVCVVGFHTCNSTQSH